MPDPELAVPGAAGAGSRRAVLIEVCLATLAVAAVIAAVELLARVSSFVAVQGGAAVAVAFLAVPLLVGRWRRLQGDPLGLDGAVAPGLRLGLAASVAVLLPFAIGFHLLQTQFLGRAPGGPGLRAPPAAFDGRPDPLPKVGAAAWRHERGLAVENGGAVVLRVEPLCDPRASTPGATAAAKGGVAPATATAERVQDCTARVLHPGSTTVLGTAAAAAFRVRTLAGTEVPVVAGSAAAELDQPVEAPAGFGWLAWLVLAQLVVVAVPEEAFFRGYVQRRLRQVLPPRHRLLGVPFGMAHLLSALLFAVVHLVAVPSPHRLLVFFPGLVFAWLAERSGSAVAPAVHHTLANVALAALQRCYVVVR